MDWQIYAWMAVLTLAQIIQVLIKRRNGKNEKAQTAYRFNPHPPGDAQTCKDHGEAIAEIRADIRNIKEDIRRIENKLNGVK